MVVISVMMGAIKLIVLPGISKKEMETGLELPINQCNPSRTVAKRILRVP
jgi:hypothetical protein